MLCVPYTLFVNHLQYQIHGYPHLLPLYAFFFSARSAIFFYRSTAKTIRKKSSIGNLYILPYDKYRPMNLVEYQIRRHWFRCCDKSMQPPYQQTVYRYAVSPLHYFGVEIEYIFDRYACNLVCIST